MADPSHSTSLSEFLRWWGDELRGLVPGGLARRSKARPLRLVIGVEGDAFSLIDPAQTRRGAGGALELSSRPALMQRLGELGRSGRRPVVGLRVPHAACFERRLELPAGARMQLDKVLALDLERNSPFQAADIRSAHLVDPMPAAGDRIAVQQLVLKRSKVDPLIDEIEALGVEVGRLDCWSETGETALPIDFLEQHGNETPAPRAPRAIAAALALASLLLLASAAYIAIDKHENALRALEAKTARLKVEARRRNDELQKSQSQLAEFAKLQRLRADYVSKARTLDELTKLAPDSAFAIDLRLDGTTLDVTGLAASAAGLLRVLERSAAFVDATMTAPLTFDQPLQKERFSLRMRLRNAVASPDKPPEVAQ